MQLTVTSSTKDLIYYQVLRGIPLLERDILPIISKPIPVVAIDDLPKEFKDKNDEARAVMISEEKHAPRLVRIVR